MRALKASAGYFAVVFTVGFVLGVIRISLLVPALGVRWAELLELPVMLLACYWAARYFVGRYGPFSAARRLGIGLLALALLLTAEVVLTIALGQSIGDYVAGRDPVSGVAYLISLLIFAALPLIVGLGNGTRTRK